MHFLRLVSTVTLAFTAAACSDSNSPATDINANRTGSTGGTAGGASTGAGGSGGMTPAASNGGSGSETPATPALNQGGGAANPGGAAAGAGGMVAAGDAGGAVAAGMSFFLSSTGGPNGGNFGGIDGADAFCTTLAAAVDPALGAKTWRAYLSTSTVDARDRIGSGPWRNAAGVVIGNDVDQLHAQTPGMNMNMPTGAASETTYPINSNATPLDERGIALPNNPVLHDTLTGSNIDGTVSDIGTCSDWTSTMGMTSVGHSNRTGGGNNSSSWNSAHGTPCAALNPPGTNQSGTVGQGGGRGSIYCFAID